MPSGIGQFGIGLASSPLRMMGGAGSPSASSGNFFSRNGLGNNFGDFAQGIRGVTSNFAAGFGKDPYVRAQAAQTAQGIEAQQADSRRQILEWTFGNLETLAQGIQGMGAIPPALNAYFEKSYQNLQSLGVDPSIIEETRNYVQAVAQMPAAQAEAQFQQFYNPQTKQSLAVNTNDPNALAQAQAQGFTSLGSPESSDVLSDERLQQDLLKAQAGRDQTTISMPPVESAFQKKLGESRGEESAILGRAANRGINTIGEVQATGALIENMMAAGNDPGKLADLRANIAGYMQAVGLDPSDLGLPADAGPTQAVNAALNKLALQFIGAEQGGLPANTFSEADRKFITQIAGTTADTPEALRLKLEAIRRAAEQVVKQNNMWLQYPQTEQGYEQFTQDWSKISLAKNAFDDLKKASVEKFKNLTNSKETTLEQPKRMKFDEQGNRVE